MIVMMVLSVELLLLMMMMMMMLIRPKTGRASVVDNHDIETRRGLLMPQRLNILQQIPFFHNGRLFFGLLLV